MMVLTTRAVSQTHFEETPFLWFGKQYADSSSGIAPAIYDLYKDIPFIYPSASNCLAGNPISQDETEAANLIWNQLNSNEEVEVCLFRVLAKVRDKEKIIAWMSRQGWVFQEIVDSSNTAFLLKSHGPVVQVGFRWNAKVNGAPFGDSDVQKSYLRFNLSSKITVLLDDERGVLSLTIDGQSIWSK